MSWNPAPVGTQQRSIKGAARAALLHNLCMVLGDCIDCKQFKDLMPHLSPAQANSVLSCALPMCSSSLDASHKCLETSFSLEETAQSTPDMSS